MRDIEYIIATNGRTYYPGPDRRFILSVGGGKGMKVDVVSEVYTQRNEHGDGRGPYTRMIVDRWFPVNNLIEIKWEEPK